jgi:hypothetical protein
MGFNSGLKGLNMYNTMSNLISNPLNLNLMLKWPIISAMYWSIN